jgi:hypothetical protein
MHIREKEDLTGRLQTGKKRDKFKAIYIWQILINKNNPG